jgi:RND family efflux transporter MFP subunit
MMKNPLRSPQRRELAVGLVAMLLGCTALSLVGKEREAPKPAAAAADSAALTVELTTPRAQTLSRSIAASGTVAARDELLIGSDASGVRLNQVLVEVGARVQRGQLLARGDDAQLQAQLAQQLALIKQAQAEHEQADANLERAERIADSGIYSVEAVQTRRTAALAAAAKLELAQAQRRELDVRIAHTQVLAPAAGVISMRSASVGLVMNPGAELFRLIRDEQLEWHAELPDHALAQVQPGATARITLDDGSAIEGRVRLVAPTIDARSRNGRVYVTLPAGAPLKAGGHAKGEIVLAEATMLTLPEAVVFNRDGTAFVYVVGDDHKARLTRIGTGARQRGLVEVSAGLQPGARVVATGAGFVKDGERVRIAAPAARTEGART